MAIRYDDEKEGDAVTPPAPVAPPAPMAPVSEAPRTIRYDAAKPSAASTFGQQVVGGVLDTIPSVAAAAEAINVPARLARMGAQAAGVPIPDNSGEALRQDIRKWADIPDVEDLPEDLRPVGYAGNVIGGALLPLAGQLKLATSAVRFGAHEGAGVVSRFMDRALDLAARRPVTVAAGELSAAGTSGAAEALAETADPGNPWTRVPAGIVGGLISPMSWVSSALDTVQRGYQRIRGATSSVGQNTRAATDLQRVVKEAGADPEALAASIDAAKASGATGTVGQMTGDATLMRVENTLAQRSAQFDSERAEMGRLALERTRNEIDRLTSVGDPASLQRAAKLRDRYFKDTLAGMAEVAEREAMQAVERMALRTDVTQSELSAKAAEILGAALQRARALERHLYGLVQDAPKGVDNFLGAYDNVRANDLLPTSRLDPEIESYVNYVRKADEEAPRIVTRSGERVKAVEKPASTIKELQKLRSKLLDLARGADLNGQANEARIYGNLAEAVLDDLGADALPGTALGNARDFSRHLNDTFTRTFAGSSASTNNLGATRLPPEALMKRATAGGNELAALRVRDLKRAVEFGDDAVKRLGTDAESAAGELLGIQESFLRNLAARAVDEQTGLVSRRKLATFVRQYAEVLDEFPALKADLANADTAQALLEQTRKTVANAEKAIDKQAAFAAVAGAENPVLAVSRALTSAQPGEKFRQLAVLARRGGQDAVDGLQSAVLQDAVQRSLLPDGTIDFQKLHRTLTRPRVAGTDSPLDLMRRYGVLDNDTTRRLNTLIERASKVEEAMRGGRGVDDLLEADNALRDFVIRVHGAPLGTMVGRALPGNVGGSGLQQAAAGSKMLSTIFNKLPVGKAQDALIAAAKNPDVFADMLRTPTSTAEAFRIAGRLHSYLFSVGLLEPVPEGAPPKEQQQ